MKVLLVNGSPTKNGCTDTALTEVANAINNEGIEPRYTGLVIKLFPVALPAINAGKRGNVLLMMRLMILWRWQRALMVLYSVHLFITLLRAGAITSFMDRSFFSAALSGRRYFYLKPAACVVSARRGGTTAAFDQLMKYFTISEMPVISSRYWNMVHGSNPEEVKKDLEGMQIMRVLGKNMAWFLKCKEAGEKAGVPLPQREDIIFTNFIR